MARDKKDFEAIIDMLSAHFKRSGIDEQTLEKEAGLEPGTILEIQDKSATYFKYGIGSTEDGRQFFAIPCSLDEDAFQDDIHLKAIKAQLDSGALQAHDLSMEYLDVERHYMEQWDFDDSCWTLADVDESFTSSQSFNFVPKDTFYEEFANALEKRGATIGGLECQ